MKKVLNNIKKWFKSHKKLSIILGVSLVIVIALIVSVSTIANIIMPDTRESVYGDRCSITEKYKVDSKKEDELKKFFKKYDFVTFNALDVKCNLIDIVITVPDKTSFNDVKDMSKELLKVFSADQLRTYDIELLVKSDNDKSENYPQVGTHHKEIDGKSNDSFVW